MNRESFLKILRAAFNLIEVILVEAGRYPAESVKKMTDNFYKQLTGK